ncbi:MAG: 3-deoxy-D-manno-octulosonic acid transferase [Candidatus Omnitrophica bacterium]|nr:3-deoxy-D-manno-octulosonic acid transferase [Candidatus Omnitrophota bacterium]
MSILYDLFFLIFSIIYVPFLLIKGKFHKDFIQRFGFLPEEITSLDSPVWIHAVSVGEAVLATKLAAAIKNRYGDIPVVISTTTQTGNNMARKSAGSAANGIFYYPLDFSLVARHVAKKINPRLYVMVETELWPNLLAQLKSCRIPVILANGRISDSSFANYKRIDFITKRIFECIDLCCMQSERDAERVQALGAEGDQVCVTGNMKFDEKTVLPEASPFSREYLGFNKDDEVIVAGSTHSPEEAIVIGIYKKLIRSSKHLKLVLAPRHVERSDEVGAYIEKEGFQYKRFSEIHKNNGTEEGDYDIVLVDTIGHLKDLYSVATVVFIGGSIAKKGGQNPIEAARWGKAVVFGPAMSNFREISNICLSSNAAVAVKDASELQDVFKKLLADDSKRTKIAANASGVIARNIGALDRTVDRLGEYVG